jgi:TrmH family RNA methyltransferase
MSYDISSPSNERVKALVRLRDRKYRDASGTFLVEGLREVERAIDAEVEIDEFYLCPDFGAHDMPSDVPVTTVSATVFTKFSKRQNPDGVLAVARQWTTSLDDIVLSATPLVLVAEAIEKPGNLGAMLRTADAAGIDAVVVCDPVVDVFNPNVVRASQGSLFSVAVGVGATTAVLAWLARNNIAVVTTFLDAATTYSDVDYTGPTAIVVGAESTGLTDTWRQVGTAASLPMSGGADSLNTATAAAIVTYEAVRQRSA